MRDWNGIWGTAAERGCGSQQVGLLEFALQRAKLGPCLIRTLKRELQQQARSYTGCRGKPVIIADDRREVIGIASPYR